MQVEIREDMTLERPMLIFPLGTGQSPKQTKDNTQAQSHNFGVLKSQCLDCKTVTEARKLGRQYPRKREHSQESLNIFI